MKNNNLYKAFRRGVLLLFSAIAVSSCNVNDDDFFILPDRNGMDAAIWSTAGAVNMHLNRTYEVIIPRFPYQNVPDRFDIHLVSDENFFPSNGGWGARALGITGAPLTNNDVRYAAWKYTFNYLDNRYLDIARCNNAIKYIPEGSMSEVDKGNFLGQYYAMRAMVYLELVKVYGGVPLVLEPQDAENIEARGRASAKQCFDLIVDDLNKSMEYLKDISWSSSEWGRITYAAAASLKAKALLYYASPQFNPLDDPKHPYDQSRWTIALQANKEAYDICLAAGRSLVPVYDDIFRVKGVANPETIISRPYSNSRQNRGHDEERKSRPNSEGGSPHSSYRATLKLLRAYPMKDGNKIGQSAYTYDDVLFWKDRDPRFQATFAYNGSKWPLSGKGERRQWTYVGAVGEGANWGVYCKRFSTPELALGSVAYANGMYGSGMDWIEMRFAEVMLNYADCANETGNLGTAKEMVRRIRQRAGIEMGTNDYGLGGIASLEDMRKFIVDERMIEFAFENKRNSDLRRTRNWHKLTGEQLQTIQIEPVGETGDDMTATRGVLQAINPATGQSMREGLDINNKSVYLQYFKPYITLNLGTAFRPIDIPAYHNFYTFNNDFVWRGVDIYPTIGWEGGVFDPLDNN